MLTHSYRRGTNEQLRLFVETVKDYAIFLLDPAGNIVTWNAGAERIKGYKSEEIIGKHFSIFYSAEDQQRHKPGKELEVAAAEGQVEGRDRRCGKMARSSGPTWSLRPLRIPQAR